MKNVLLVYNDYLAKSYIKSFLAWEKANFKITSETEDVKESLTILKKERIDLAILCVDLHLSTNLDLISKIKKYNKNIYIIVFSDYKDFECVRDTILRGVDDYILKKSLTEHFLYTLLLKTRKNIEKTKISSTSLQEIEDDENSSKKYLFFNQILAGALTNDEIIEKKKKLGIKGEYIKSAAIIIYIKKLEYEDDPLADIKKEQYYLNFLIKIKKELNKIDMETYIEKEIIYLNNGYFCCFLDLSFDYKISNMNKSINHIANVIYNVCKKENFPYTIGISNICIDNNSIRTAYQQAQMTIKVNFYNKEKIAFYNENKVITNYLPKNAEDMINRLNILKSNCTKNDFLKIGNDVINSFKTNLTDSKLVIRWLKNITQILEEPFKNFSYNDIHNINDVEKIFLDTLEKAFDNTLYVPKNLNKIIYSIIDFLEKYYKEPIGLTDIASAVGMNSSYISHLFRQEMGIGFSSYLLNLRIKNAKKLLKETNLKLYQISEVSGFNDYHYFSKVFKKINGISPAEYRKINTI